MLCKNILTSYQLENYKTFRFLKFIYSHPKFWILGGDRQKIVWTKKAISIAIITLIIAIIKLVLYILLYYNNISTIVDILYFCIWLLAFPIYMIIANYLLFPIDFILKRKIIKTAEKKLKKLKKIEKLKVIGITGSYGKTSQKEILETILKENFKVLSTTGNKNTPLGISEIIINELNETHDIFIVEMGAYIKGDIKDLCDIVEPEIGILTGITLQHLERFKNINNIIKTKFELIESLDEKGLAILSTSNENVKKGLEERIKKLKVKNIKEINNPEKINYLDNLAGISFDYDKNTIETKLLAEHSASQIITAYEIAKYLKMPTQKILNGIKNINYIKHRLELIYNPNSNLYVIDDSFNGNIEGVKSTIKLLENIKGHRKLYLTPGLVELGKETFSIHHEIGKMLANVIDKALLIENPATKSIFNGLKSAGFDTKNIILYKSTNDAHNDLKNILESNDVIIFQNDWTDNYF
ncbi:MAG: Mur ligase family protein [Candidatus Gracilibacteria bacterium]|nr:Mur ligase family protein [Candidatus Gracilibacteria bacterium]